MATSRAWLVAAVLLVARSAAAEPLAVAVDRGLDERAPGLASRVRAAFEGREDLDHRARVALSTRGTWIVIDVALTDGRSTSREVRSAADVVPALEALLLVPHAAAPPAEKESHSAPLEPLVSEDASVPVFLAPEGVANRDVVTPLPAPSHLRFELSAEVGGRGGDGQSSVGGGLQSFIEVSRWLVGFGGRLDRYKSFSSPRDGAALELALLGGRRVHWKYVSVDAVAGPALAASGGSSYVAQRPTGTISGSSGSALLPRAVIGARASLFPESIFRPFVALDGSFGPSSIGETDAGAVPLHTLPTWTLGAAVGGTVGSR